MGGMNRTDGMTKILALLLSLAIVLMSGMSIASAQDADEAGQLSGRLGGSLADVQARFGDPSWTDVGLIGYNSEILVGVDSIVVVYYDERDIVDKISLVYLEEPAQFSDKKAIADVVAEVTPMDGTCGAMPLSASDFGDEVYSCKSSALAFPFNTAIMGGLQIQGSPGEYSYSVGPTDDQYFEIIVQPGTATTPVTSVAINETVEQSSGSSTNSSQADAAPEDSAAEASYAATVYLQTQRMAKSLNAFSDLTADPQFFSDTWLLNVAIELATWKQIYQDALALTPPPRFVMVHAKYVEALSYLDQAADEIAYGIDNLDLAAMERAVALLDLSTATIHDALEEIDAITG